MGRHGPSSAGNSGVPGNLGNGECVTCRFNNRLSDSNPTLPAVVRGLVPRNASVRPSALTVSAVVCRTCGLTLPRNGDLGSLPRRVGTWEGTINFGVPLRLVLTISNGKDGAEALMVSLDQGNAQIPVSAVLQKDKKLTLKGGVKLGGGRGFLSKRAGWPLGASQ